MSSDDTKIKRVFILGAGFSKQAGMPLATDLMDHMHRKFQKQKGDDALKWLGFLQERIAWLEGGNSYKINIEEIFDFAWFDIEAFKMKQQSCQVGREDGDTPQQDAESRLNWLNWMEYYLVDVIWEEQKKSEKKLHLIDKFSTHLGPDDAVITFNYDTLLEESLEKQKKKWWYGFKKKEDFGLKILKMHGSINWAMVPRKLQGNFDYPLLFEKENKNVEDHGAEEPDEIEYKYVLFRIPDKCLSNRIENRKLQEDSKLPFIAIAGLGKYKPLSNLVGSYEVWNNAIGALRNCDEIYIVGFSLSPFDNMARLYFGDAMMERFKREDIKLPKVTLIDPNACGVKDNFKSVFGGQNAIDLIQKQAEEVDWGGLLS
mgnify:CR=1 FL=1